MWFSPVPGDSVWELHVCCKPGWEGRWLKKNIIQTAFQVLDTLKARYVVAIHGDPTFKRALRRLGFTAGDNVNILDMKELEHGENSGSRLWRARSS